jgi:hypothetical protein
MKTQNKKSTRQSPSKGRTTGTEKTSAPRTKNQERYEEQEPEDDDITSTTPDPTQPDEETSHKKKHKIGFKTKK